MGVSHPPIAGLIHPCRGFAWRSGPPDQPPARRALPTTVGTGGPAAVVEMGPESRAGVSELHVHPNQIGSEHHAARNVRRRRAVRPPLREVSCHLLAAGPAITRQHGSAGLATRPASREAGGAGAAG
jgi:hypothetical protein